MVVVVDDASVVVVSSFEVVGFGSSDVEEVWGGIISVVVVVGTSGVPVEEVVVVLSDTVDVEGVEVERLEAVGRFAVVVVAEVPLLVGDTVVSSVAEVEVDCLVTGVLEVVEDVSVVELESVTDAVVSVPVVDGDVKSVVVDEVDELEIVDVAVDLSPVVVDEETSDVDVSRSVVLDMDVEKDEAVVSGVSDVEVAPEVVISWVVDPVLGETVTVEDSVGVSVVVSNPEVVVD